MLRLSLFLLAATMASMPTALLAQSDGCKICLDGSDVPYPEQPLEVEEGAIIPVDSCGALEAAVDISVISPGDANCVSAQAGAAVCGCPVPDGVCRICGEGLWVSFESSEIVTSVDTAEYIQQAPKINMTCIAMEGFLHTEDDGSEVCEMFKASDGDKCCTDAVEERPSFYTPETDAPTPARVTDAPSDAGTTRSGSRIMAGLLGLIASGYLMFW